MVVTLKLIRMCDPGDGQFEDAMNCRGGTPTRARKHPFGEGKTGYMFPRIP